MLDQLKVLFDRSDDETSPGVVVTTQQAAAMLRVTDRRVRQLVETGILPAVKERRNQFDKHGRWAILAQDVVAPKLARRRRARMANR